MEVRKQFCLVRGGQDLGYVVLNIIELLGFASKLDVEKDRRLEVSPCILNGGGGLVCCLLKSP